MQMVIGAISQKVTTFPVHSCNQRFYQGRKPFMFTKAQVRTSSFVWGTKAAWKEMPSIYGRLYIQQSRHSVFNCFSTNGSLHCSIKLMTGIITQCTNSTNMWKIKQNNCRLNSVFKYHLSSFVQLKLAFSGLQIPSFSITPFCLDALVFQDLCIQLDSASATSVSYFCSSTVL